MKPLFFSMLFVLSAACGGSETKGESNQTKLVPANDQLAGNCDQEIALQCAEGSVDGCTITDESGVSLTLSHICLPASESAGPPCEQEIARVCDEGLIDACLLTPVAAMTHVCVSQPATSNDMGTEPEQEQEQDGEE